MPKTTKTPQQKKIDSNNSIASVIEHDYSLFIKKNEFTKNKKQQKKLIIDSLDRLKLKYKKLTYSKLTNKLIKISFDGYTLFMLNELPETSSLPGLYISSNKEVSKQFIHQSGVATPLGKVFKRHELKQAWHWVQANFNCAVIKPISGAEGDYVQVNLSTEKEFISAWNDTALSGQDILVEQMIKGYDHRLLVVGNTFIAATKRTPLTIIGDGLHNINELIEIKNKKRKFNPETAAKKPIAINPNIQKYLHKYNLMPETIIEKGKKYQLSDIANVSKGGEHEDVTDKVHYDFRLIAQQLAKTLPSLNHLGIDLMAQDISQSPKTQSWAVIEINSIPSLKHHHFPISGHSRDVLSKVIENSLLVKSKQIISLAEQQFSCTFAPIVNNKNETFYSSNTAIQKDLIIRSACERNIAINIIDRRLFSLSFADKIHYFKDVVPDSTSIIAHKLTMNNELTQKVLNAAQINSVKRRKFSIHQTEIAWQYIQKLTFPATIKSVIALSGKAIFPNITTKKQLIGAIKTLNRKFYMIEEPQQGLHYCLTLILGQFIACIKLTPANVIGDGKQTLAELIREKNNYRKKNPYSTSSPISISAEIKKQLDLTGITENTIIKEKEMIYLQQMATIETGADSEDVTEIVHSDFQQIALTTWKAFPAMHYGSIKIITSDISQSAAEQNWAIEKVDSSPDLALHYFPIFGKGRDIAAILLDSLFPQAIIEAQKTPLIIVSLMISGKVQKVNYRNWLKKQAQLHAINGWVKNLDNGKVEALLTGMPKAVEYLITLCKMGPNRAEVKQIETMIL